MDLLKTLQEEDLEKYVDVFMSQSGARHTDTIKERLIFIWLDYINSNEGSNVYPLNTIMTEDNYKGCHSCYEKMMRLMYSNKEKQKDQPKIYKAIKEKVEVIEPVKVKNSDQSYVVETHPEMSEDAKIAHLRQALQEKGIKWHHKSKSKKLQKQLDEASN